MRFLVYTVLWMVQELTVGLLRWFQGFGLIVQGSQRLPFLAFSRAPSNSEHPFSYCLVLIRGPTNKKGERVDVLYWEPSRPQTIIDSLQVPLRSPSKGYYCFCLSSPPKHPPRTSHRRRRSARWKSGATPLPICFAASCSGFIRLGCFMLFKGSIRFSVERFLGSQKLRVYVVH